MISIVRYISFCLLTRPFKFSLEYLNVFMCIYSQATMICVDNSEWMRNGDYAPSRFQALADTVNLICGAKTQVHSYVHICMSCILLQLLKIRRAR